VKFKKYLKSKSYVIKTSDNKDVNIERNNSRDSLDVIDPFQFNHTNDKRFDELQCNTEPKNTPLIPKIRLILDNVATDENEFSRRKVSKSDMHLFDENSYSNYNLEKDSTCYDMANLGLESENSSKVFNIKNYEDLEKSSGNKYAGFFFEN